LFDIAVSGASQNDLFVVPGERANLADRGFTATERRVLSPGNNVGQSIASSFHPAFGGVIGDLDGDGTTELLAGTRINHRVMLFYPDTFAAAAANAPPTPTDAGIVYILGASPSDGETLVVQYVGDINGDGHLDIAIGDPAANGDTGQIVVMY
jgi:hypothetical protein